jgi:glycosyltransferase involved in cell wall biosynthesis
MHRYAASLGHVRFIQVDTAPHWRAMDDVAVWKRALGGGLQLIRDCAVLIRMLLRKPDLIHLTTSGQLATVRDTVICSISRVFNVPVVYHIHLGRLPAIAAANTLEWRVMACALRLASVVVVIDCATVDAIEAFLPDVRVEYIPNPIDLSRLPNPTTDDTSCRSALFLGWIIPTKGIEELVKAWTQLAPEGWELLVVGPGNSAYRQGLLQRYDPKHVSFLGEVSHDDAMRLMAACDLFVLPSYTEGFPNVVLEAMALGKPIIATSVGAIPKMLSDECGLLVEPKDVMGLEKALAWLIQEERIRREFGEKARIRVQEEYSIDVVFARYTDIWQYAISKNQR